MEIRRLHSAEITQCYAVSAEGGSNLVASSAMLMVILGAGASYDSSPDHPAGRGAAANRPPLADDLFINEGVFAEARGEFSEFHELIPELLPRAGRTVEQSLQRLQDEGANSPERQRQLTAVRYYLQLAFRTLSDRWLKGIAGVTNYRALLGQIRHHQKGKEPVCLVTFNYDTLIEAALAHYGMQFEVPNDYITGAEFKLFKLHGSANWGRHLEGNLPAALLRAPPNDPWGDPHLVIRHVDAANISDNFTVSGIPGRKHAGPPLYPAIAIPVLRKDTYECPHSHVGALTKLIPQVTRVLAIGWRGTELHFQHMLRQLGPIKIVTVAGSKEEAQKILNNIRTLGMPVLDYAAFASFSDVLAERTLDPLLSSD
jgi:hypothetical protein